MDRLPVDIDIVAIAVMESFGVVSFLVAFLFFRQRQRISDKKRVFLDALNRQVIGERSDGKCFSSEWVMDNIVHKPRKLFNITPFLLAAFGSLMAILYFFVLPHILAKLILLGYVPVIALIGIAILLWTDAFEAYTYTNVIRKVATEKLDKEDLSYIELARETVEKAFLRFFSLGFAFALLGPFIPQVFNGVVYGFMLCTTVFFKASEASLNVLTVFGILIVLILPGLMIFLPEFLGRIVIRKGRSLVRRVFRRRVEQ